MIGVIEWDGQRLGIGTALLDSVPMVAITGSNGKTSTKEILATILGARWGVLKPPGCGNARPQNMVLGRIDFLSLYCSSSTCLCCEASCAPRATV